MVMSICDVLVSMCLKCTFPVNAMLLFFLFQSARLAWITQISVFFGSLLTSILPETFVHFEDCFFKSKDT